MRNSFKSGLVHFLIYFASNIPAVFFIIFSAHKDMRFEFFIPLLFAVVVFTSPFIYGYFINRIYIHKTDYGFAEFYLFGLKHYFTYYLMIFVANLIISAPLLLILVMVAFIHVSRPFVYLYCVFSLMVFVLVSGFLVRRWLYRDMFETGK